MLREILVISFIFLFVSCSSTNEINTNNKSDITLYREGMNLLRKKEFDSAVEIFTELPSSPKLGVLANADITQT